MEGVHSPLLGFYFWFSIIDIALMYWHKGLLLLLLLNDSKWLSSNLRLSATSISFKNKYFKIIIENVSKAYPLWFSVLIERMEPPPLLVVLRWAGTLCNITFLHWALLCFISTVSHLTTDPQDHRWY